MLVEALQNLGFNLQEDTNDFLNFRKYNNGILDYTDLLIIKDPETGELLFTKTHNWTLGGIPHTEDCLLTEEEYDTLDKSEVLELMSQTRNYVV